MSLGKAALPAAVQERVLRVSQLDATELDEELAEILQDHFISIFRILPSVHLLQLKPELRALVRLLIWRYSIYTHGQTFGQQMLDLSYSLGQNNYFPVTFRYKFALFFLTVIAEWMKDRFHTISRIVPVSLQPSVVNRVLDRILSIIKSLSLINFIVFLLNGHFPTLKERVLGLQMVPERPQTLRQMSYEYMNREILWHGFSEFIFFILPHFNLFAIRNWLRRCLTYQRGSTAENGVPILKPVDFSSCAFCDQVPTMPHVTGCGHVYCYYCIRANCLADSSFPCTVCGTAVSKCMPARLQGHSGDT